MTWSAVSSEDPVAPLGRRPAGGCWFGPYGRDGEQWGIGGSFRQNVVCIRCLPRSEARGRCRVWQLECAGPFIALVESVGEKLVGDAGAVSESDLQKNL